MCGIIGYTGHRPAIPIILDGLRRLEYRGYDSAGIAFTEHKKLEVIRSKGKLNALEDKIYQHDALNTTTGIGHTRWATHGLPIEQNAHPHIDDTNSLALVHNGIIENFQNLKQELKESGSIFYSDTDTEVLVQLISQGKKLTGSISNALKYALDKVEGSYAIALISLDEKEEIWAARHCSPLILGIGTGENFIASDIPAFLPYTRDVVFLEDGEIAHIKPNSWQVFKYKDLKSVQKSSQYISWNVQDAQKSGYKHFMLKEIIEQPQVIRNCLSGRLDYNNKKVILPELDNLLFPNRLHIVACGTSYHAGLWAKYILEEWAQIPVNVDIGSEFRYRHFISFSNDLALVISQSGETADTLAGMRKLRENNVAVVGLCNVLGSTVAREADRVLYTQAGPEISVASTKAMCSQMIVLLLLALYWGQKKNTLTQSIQENTINDLMNLPQTLESELSKIQKNAQLLSSKYCKTQNFFYLGRGLNFPLALEGALKLKEISYIHAEGYAAGEMKHGPIALIEPEFPTFALAPKDMLLAKLKSNLQEIKARGGPLIAITHPEVDLDIEDRWEIPYLQEPLNSFMILPALQMFAYEMAVYLGKDVDQPRNLAKSVTVE